MMDPLPDPMAAAAIAPSVLFVVQAAKSLRWWRAAWCVPFALLLGVVLALGGVLAAHHFDWAQALANDPVGVWQAFVNGLTGGAAAPPTYTAQSRLLGDKAPLKPIKAAVVEIVAEPVIPPVVPVAPVLPIVTAEPERSLR
jgi:hypothetical protein